MVRALKQACNCRINYKLFMLFISSGLPCVPDHVVGSFVGEFTLERNLVNVFKLI